MKKWLAWQTVGKEVAKPKVDFSGKWKNPLGSSMELKVRGNKVSGTYRTGVGAPGSMEEFPLVGFVNGDILGFTVLWGKYGSITSWVGQHTASKKKDRIDTMWHLVKNIDEESERQNVWGSYLTGANSFTR